MLWSADSSHPLKGPAWRLSAFSGVKDQSKYQEKGKLFSTDTTKCPCVLRWPSHSKCHVTPSGAQSRSLICVQTASVTFFSFNSVFENEGTARELGGKYAAGASCWTCDSWQLFSLGRCYSLHVLLVLRVPTVTHKPPLSSCFLPLSFAATFNCLFNVFILFSGLIQNQSPVWTNSNRICCPLKLHSINFLLIKSAWQPPTGHLSGLVDECPPLVL